MNIGFLFWQRWQLMNLYLIQHGEAVNETVDPARPLSERGVREVKAPLDSILPRSGTVARRVPVRRPNISYPILRLADTSSSRRG